MTENEKETVKKDFLTYSKFMMYLTSNRKHIGE